jgi:hypothetical protein
MAVRLGLALSAAGTVYAIGGATLEGALFWPTPRETVAVARWIDSHTPPHSVVAIHPDDNSRAIGYWLRRRVVLADHRRDAIMLGATPSELDPIDRRLREAFDSRDSVTAARSFADLEADVVLVKVGDRPEPPWARPPCFQLAHEQPPFKVFLRLAEGCRSP